MQPIRVAPNTAGPSNSNSQTTSFAKPTGIDSTRLTIQKVDKPSSLSNPEDLVFGRTFTDHMLVIEWTETDGWKAPQIRPYQPLSLDPATCVLHYASSCFEGMKAYKDAAGRTRLFRPEKNLARLNQSAARIALPTFEPNALLTLIAEYVKLEQRFIPTARGYSLYLRPTLIGTQATLGLAPPSSATLFVIASPVGPYYRTGFNKAISLEATNAAVRAWPGGVGDRKLGANYAPCVVLQAEAAARGHQQVLWLFGQEEFVTEVGTMNMFVVMRSTSGAKELVTAPLDGTILKGVTRDSVLALAREKLVPQGWVVAERKYTMGELAEAAECGRLLEAFGAGTAATITPIRTIEWKGRKVECGLTEGQESGEIALMMKSWIEERQYGDVDHEWSHIIS